MNLAFDENDYRKELKKYRKLLTEQMKKTEPDEGSVEEYKEEIQCYKTRIEEIQKNPQYKLDLTSIINSINEEIKMFKEGYITLSDEQYENLIETKQDYEERLSSVEDWLKIGWENVNNYV